MDKAELIEKLRETDEVILVELLNLTSTDIVDAFLDVINDNEAHIRKAIEED